MESIDKQTELFILNCLRRHFIESTQYKKCLKAARKAVVEGKLKNGKPAKKLYWQCASCKQWERNEAQIEVDHIEEIGKQETLLKKIAVMFDQKNLQALCVSCHQKKTATFNASRVLKRKIIFEE